MDSRSQLVTLLTQKVLSSGRRTTAQFVRDIINALIISVPNIPDDANAINGYMALDANGLVDITKLAVITPSGAYLRDDGTYQPSTGSGNVILNNAPSAQITANKFIRSVGTSNDFLKADGTIDSNSYLTSLTGLIIAGSFSQAVVATTTINVPIGSTMSSNTYKVNVTPSNLLSAALFYVTNKTTTTFDVTYLSGLTGTVAFDWILAR